MSEYFHIQSPPEVRTLRDEFAMAALMGILANPECTAQAGRVDRLADRAYQFADAMLAAREVRPGQTKGEM